MWLRKGREVVAGGGIEAGAHNLILLISPAKTALVRLPQAEIYPTRQLYCSDRHPVSFSKINS